MANPKAAELEAALRMLPSTDEVLTSPPVNVLIPEIGRGRATAIVRSAVGELRTELAKEITTSSSHAATFSKESLLANACERFQKLWTKHRSSRLRRVINATGVVIHTNLGRAPLSAKAIEAIKESAGYCTLEYDLANGKRGKRGEYLEGLLTEATGAEAALVVNNCAAAAYLVLTVFAKGGEAIVSRGELVEIGGDFRIPDVLTQSGGTLKEVGTTNRTKLSDYEKAIGDNTKILMRVHPSNYKIVGFTDKPTLADLAALAHKKGILLYEDAGSGALLDFAKFGLTDEPLISRSITDGAGLVTFSGDKLLGGTQAGIIVGRKNLIEQIRKHPLYRALRVSKLVYAVLEATVESYVREDAEQSVPVLKMLGLQKEELEQRTRDLARRLNDSIESKGLVTTDVVAGESVVGGGSGPDIRQKTSLLVIGHLTMSAAEIERKLRAGETPVIVRIENDKLLIDMRTVQEIEEDELTNALVAALG
jgi:L-seryl-tRNA(Ser) seleniumtransferase